MTDAPLGSLLAAALAQTPRPKKTAAPTPARAADAPQQLGDALAAALADRNG